MGEIRRPKSWKSSGDSNWLVPMATHDPEVEALGTAPTLPIPQALGAEVEQSGTESSELVKALWAITAELREIRIQLSVSNALRSGDGYPGT
jgi:hypothetical protein